MLTKKENKMYVQKGKRISKTTIEKAVRKATEEYSRYNKTKIRLDDGYGDNTAHIVNDLYELNVALLKGNDVYVECVKEPRGNLDTGNHYYDVYYIKNNRRHKVWMFDFIRVLGGKDQNKDYSMSKYVWYSGAIGMSRQLDATDGLFTFLKRIGGCYAQL
jgi:hypothetical protein